MGSTAGGTVAATVGGGGAGARCAFLDNSTVICFINLCSNYIVKSLHIVSQTLGHVVYYSVLYYCVTYYSEIYYSVF